MKNLVCLSLVIALIGVISVNAAATPKKGKNKKCVNGLHPREILVLFG